MGAPRTVGDIMDDLARDGIGPARDGIGGNNPPSPFEAAASAVADVAGESRMYLDGKPIASQEQADDIAELLNMARKAEKQADDARKAEAAPFDAGKADVQARYVPLVNEAKRVATALKAASTAWLVKVEDAQRAKAEALRIVAVAAAELARKQHAAANPANLAEVEAADAAIDASDRAARIAKKAGEAMAGAKGATATRAIGLRTYWVANLMDATAFARHCWQTPHLRAALELALLEIAAAEVRKTQASMPGVNAVEDRRAA